MLCVWNNRHVAASRKRILHFNHFLVQHGTMLVRNCENQETISFLRAWTNMQDACVDSTPRERDSIFVYRNFKTV